MTLPGAGHPEPVRVIRHADCPVMPWKNGGGSTTEIAVFPPGAGLDAFDWRVSMAEVASDGPFSAFPGIDRTLTILSGAGLRLAIGGASEVVLGPFDAPLPFPADVPTTAGLRGGPVTDLNVMTRRGRFRHTVRRLSPGPAEVVRVSAPLVLLMAEGGPARLRVGGTDFDLAERDTLAFNHGESPAPLVTALAACRLIVVELTPA